MDTYSFLREMADSWALVLLTLFFLGAIAWVFRPGSRALHEDASLTPFRHDEMPAAEAGPAQAPAFRLAGCANACEGCTCGSAAGREGRAHG